MLKLPESTYGVLEKAPCLPASSLTKQLFADARSKGDVQVIMTLPKLRMLEQTEAEDDIALIELVCVC